MVKGKSYRIALCGVTTTLAVAVLTVGHWLSFGEFFWYFVASILTDLPERTMDKALCCFSTAFLAAVLCGFNFIYLAAFCLLMAPYVLVSASVRGRPAAVRYLAVAAVSFCGLMAVCWWTPMFFVQLNAAPGSVRVNVMFVMLAVSLLFEPVYGRLYRVCRKIFLKVWTRLR